MYIKKYWGNFIGGSDDSLNLVAFLVDQKKEEIPLSEIFAKIGLDKQNWDFRSTAYPPYPHRWNSFLTVSKRLRDSSSDRGCRKNSMTDGFLFISAKGTKSSSFQSRNSKRGVSIYTILNNLYSRTKILNLFYFSKTLSLSLSISKTGQR